MEARHDLTDRTVPANDPGAAGLDLDAYFRRISYHGERAATLAVLRQLHRLHPQAIAFENLDPLLGRPVNLDLASVQDKLVRSRRGGYCFEHNLLFWQVLSALGFQVTGLAARVMWGQPDETVIPRAHMLLRIALDGETWLADVGFGRMTLTAPLRLAAGVVQSTPHEDYRIDDGGDHFRLQAAVDGDWRPVYHFDLQPQQPIDYRVSSYYMATHPQSHFTWTIMAARPTSEGRFTLSNDRLTFRGLDGTNRQRRLESTDDFVETFRTDFGVEIPDQAGFAARIRATGILKDA